jgi:hypothetical protein
MRVTFGIDELDRLLCGFEPGYFITLHGSRIGHYLSELLCVRAQLPRRDGGLNSSVIFIDGGNSFDPYLISSIAQQHNLNPQATLEKIFILRAFTAYQLTALIFDKLERALDRYNSKLVIVSDITGLFLDRDVPKREGMDVFIKMTQCLSELVSRRKVIILASCFPRHYSSRSFFLENVLFGRANAVIKLVESRSTLKFILSRHPSIKPFTIDFPSNAVTMDMFMEA